MTIDFRLFSKNEIERNIKIDWTLFGRAGKEPLLADLDEHTKALLSVEGLRVYTYTADGDCDSDCHILYRQDLTIREAKAMLAAIPLLGDAETTGMGLRALGFRKERVR